MQYTSKIEEMKQAFETALKKLCDEYKDAGPFLLVMAQALEDQAELLRDAESDTW